MSISNKNTVIGLCVIALFVVAISLISINNLSPTAGSFTGAAVGTTNVTIAGTAGITIVSSSINFSSGYYNDSCTQDYAYVGINSASYVESDNCWVNTSVKLGADDTTSHYLNNTGTTVVNITVDTDQTHAESLFCGTQGCPFTNVAKLEMLISNGEAGSCAAGYFPPGYFTMLSSSSENATAVLCNYLDYEDTNDELDIVFNFTVPKDADQGSKKITLTYTATAIS
jgi:hypothetical protein